MEKIGEIWIQRWNKIRKKVKEKMNKKKENWKNWTFFNWVFQATQFVKGWGNEKRQLPREIFPNPNTDSFVQESFNKDLSVCHCGKLFTALQAAKFLLSKTAKNFLISYRSGCTCQGIQLGNPFLRLELIL